ncbi:hypothetical protein MMC13_000497 [Lambiella insularis]|nr:hypothetical protein [Lambiella insularis]
MDKYPMESTSPSRPSPSRSWNGDLPLLPYSPDDHKAGIAIAWTVIVTNSAMLPIALLYGLWYGTALSKNVIFGIVTGTFGIASLGQFWVRMWKLLQKDDRYRPLGSKRGWLDFYQIQTLLSITITATLLATSSSLSPPSLPLLSSPPSILLLFTSLQLLSSSLFPLSTFRISSTPAGVPTRPGIYCIIEDVVAVDASAGRAYRLALDARYAASGRFRRMLWRLNWFWALGGLAVGAGVLGVVWGVRGGEGVWRFAVGWGVPWLWVGVWAWGTVRWVRGELGREKAQWGMREGGGRG